MKNRKFYSKLFISYLLLFILPVIIFGSLSFFYIAEDALQNDVEYSRKSLRHAMNAANMLLEEMDKLIIQFAMDNEINLGFNNVSLQSDYNKHKLLNKLVNFTNVNGNIVSVSLSDLNNVVFSSDYGYTSVDDYYDADWLKELQNNQIFMTDWKRRTVYQPSFDKNVSKKMELLTKGVRLRNRKGYFTINMDAGVFYKILCDFLDVSSSIYVLTATGSIVTKSENSNFLDTDIKKIFDEINFNSTEPRIGNGVCDIGGIEYNTSYIQSSQTEWFFINVTPLKTLYIRANNIKNLTIITCMVCIFVGLLASFMISLKIYNPISELLNRISSLYNVNRKTGDEIGLINNVFKSLVNENCSLNQRMSENSEIVKEKVLQDILTDHIEGLLESHFEVLKKVFCGNYYVVISVKFDLTSEKIICDFIRLFDELQSNVSMDRNMVFVKKDDIIVFVLQSDYNVFNREDICEILHHGVEIFRQRSLGNCTIGVGNIVEGYQKIHISYKNSLKAFDYVLIKGKNTVIFFDDFDSSSLDEKSAIMFGDLNEGELLKAIHSKNVEGIGNSFFESVQDFTRDKSFDRQHILGLYRQYIFFLLRYVFDNNLKLNRDINVSHLMGSETIQEMKLNIQMLSGCLIKKIPEDDNSRIVNEVAEYIAKNYAEDITLEGIANKVYMSQSHLSRLFKHYYGINFHRFLIKTRLDAADQLLICTNYQITEIAEKVGYNNLNSFTKSFKNFKGISPYDYRRQSGVLGLSSSETSK